MPSRGLTKLEAVNRILTESGQNYAAALDASGAAGRSPQAVAERFLDYMTERYQFSGNADNVRPATEISATDIGAGVYKFLTPDNTLKVRGVFKDANKVYDIVDGYLFDRHAGTDTFSSGDKAYVELIVELTWDELSPGAKEAITAEATVRYQRHTGNSPQLDQQLMSDAASMDLLNTMGDNDMPRRQRTPAFSALQLSQQPRNQN
jgi:hypothetical protein